MALKKNAILTYAENSLLLLLLECFISTDVEVVKVLYYSTVLCYGWVRINLPLFKLTVQNTG